ncbi:MAG: MBL fold metallo-hydrolase [Nanoarchaeota archaeon]|nr:MBL fold metallo-hydrolase [Nanoarchaeota archaeon]MBU1643745.1 MBL fold metallo-hydrolase [Nanoarchaeota archaeon]MBU1977100.1 MBL fold metallo-hydrolase [Nanoarchaeota archaeon]
MLKVKSFCGGYDNNFSYILYDEKTREAAIIDLAIEPKILLEFIVKNNLKLKFAVIMHSHFDHLVGYDYYKQNKIPLAASEKIKKEVDLKLKDDEELAMGSSKLKVLATPGHIYDAICILVENKLFTSDTLFIDGCGRCDLPGADVKKMQESLKRIKSLTDETVIYPGHDYGRVPFATLKEQKKTNPYL